MRVGQYVVKITTTTVKGYLGIDVGRINRGVAFAVGVLVGGVRLKIQHHEADAAAAQVFGE